MAPYDVSADAEMMLFAFAHNDVMFALHVPKAHIICPKGKHHCKKSIAVAMLFLLARPTGFEPVAYRFVAGHSIH